jgi:hypothetical protein
LTNTRKCVEYAFLAEASQFNGGQVALIATLYSETAL